MRRPILWFGLGQGIVVMVVALMLRAPQPAEVAAADVPRCSKAGVTTRLLTC